MSPAIGWVREDLDDSLATIREELEAFAEDTARKEPMEAVRQQLEKLNIIPNTWRTDFSQEELNHYIITAAKDRIY